MSNKSYKQWKRFGVALSVGAGVAVAAPAVIAQGSAGADDMQSTGLEEIVVTARKREESLQDVGLAVSALSKTEINRMF